MDEKKMIMCGLFFFLSGGQLNLELFKGPNC